MRPGTLIFVLVITIFTSASFARTQDFQSTSPAAIFTSRTEADRQQLLAKAKPGDKHAQMWLGAFYEQGLFGQPDLKQALKWLRKAAAQGDPDAQVGLGQMYENGEGVRQNYAKAAHWYRKAAEHVLDLGGAGQGRNQLGLLYLEGLGVPKDFVRAYMWFNLTGSQVNLSYARAEMSPEQVLEAERVTQHWRERHRSP